MLCSGVMSGGKRATGSKDEPATKDQQVAATQRSSITITYGSHDVQADSAGEARESTRAAFEAPSWWRGGGDHSAGAPSASGKETSAHGLAQLQQQRQQWAALAGGPQR